MRIAVFSDVHANLPALEAVLADMARRDLEGALHLGDLVGYGPHPDEVVALMRETGIEGVVGNYDLAVCAADADEGQATYLKPSISPVGRETFLWTRQNTSEASLEFLRARPAQLRVEEAGLSLLFTHGSPERPNEYLLPETPEARLAELFQGSGADVLVVGHTHLPGAREVGGKLLLNPGSVGKPKDGDPRASYLILDTEDGFRAEHVRVSFDVESVARDCVSSGLPREQAQSFLAGRSV